MRNKAVGDPKSGKILPVDSRRAEHRKGIKYQSIILGNALRSITRLCTPLDVVE